MNSVSCADCRFAVMSVSLDFRFRGNDEKAGYRHGTYSLHLLIELPNGFDLALRLVVICRAPFSKSGNRFCARKGRATSKRRVHMPTINQLVRKGRTPQKAKSKVPAMEQNPQKLSLIHI